MTKSSNSQIPATSKIAKSHFILHPIYLKGSYKIYGHVFMSYELRLNCITTPISTRVGLCAWILLHGRENKFHICRDLEL